VAAAIVVCCATMRIRESSSPFVVYRFGPYEADLNRSELRKFGIRVRLERKPWQLLLALLERPGEVVTRQQLQRLLWGDNVFVDFENGLNVAIKKLRSALNDSAEEPIYIERVAGEGYCFVGSVEKIPRESQPAFPVSSNDRLPTAATSDELAFLPSAPGPAASIMRSHYRLSRLVPLIVVLVAVAAIVIRLPKPKGRLGDATRGKRYLEAWLDLILREADARTAVAMPQKQRSTAIYPHEPIG
jgi:DNA-binding winged helix-turn-helix (wHTH) protein